MKKIHWSFDVKGTEKSVHCYFRYRSDNQPDNEIGFGIELMPRIWKATHHKSMCRFNLFLWVIALWFDYPFPITKNRYCLRCNKVNPNLQENCWVGAELFTQNPTPHIFEKFK